MGVRVVSMALATVLLTASTAAGADEPVAASLAVTPAPSSPPTLGSVPWVAAIDRPSAAWVLAVPLKLTWPPPAWSRTASGVRRIFAFEDYPDPRRAPIQSFYLELRQQQDFTLFGVPVTTRTMSYQPLVATQVAGPSMQPLWAGDAAVRLPHNLYAGASILQRVDAQRAVLFVTGQRF
jgi:hypothetical protein